MIQRGPRAALPSAVARKAAPAAAPVKDRSRKANLFASITRP